MILLLIFLFTNFFFLAAMDEDTKEWSRRIDEKIAHTKEQNRQYELRAAEYAKKRLERQESFKKCVLAIIASGGDLNQGLSDSEGCIYGLPLEFAINDINDDSFTELLLKNGANPNQPLDNAMGYCQPVLIKAMRKRNLNLVRMLLKYGADPDQLDIMKQPCRDFIPFLASYEPEIADEIVKIFQAHESSKNINNEKAS